MATDSSNITMPDDDYDVIIIESGVGDPTVFASIQFKNGADQPSRKAPLTDITIQVNLNWPKIGRSIYVGEIRIPMISTQHNYKFGIPYDDATFDIQKNAGIALQMDLTIKAKNGTQWARLRGGTPSGDGYLFVIEDIVPKIYLDQNQDSDS